MIIGYIEVEALKRPAPSGKSCLRVSLVGSVLRIVDGSNGCPRVKVLRSLTAISAVENLGTKAGTLDAGGVGYGTSGS